MLELEGCFMFREKCITAVGIDKFAHHVSAHKRREGTGALSLPRPNPGEERPWSSDRLFSGMDFYSRGKNGDDKGVSYQSSSSNELISICCFVTDHLSLIVDNPLRK